MNQQLNPVPNPISTQRQITYVQYFPVSEQVLTLCGHLLFVHLRENARNAILLSSSCTNFYATEEEQVLRISITESNIQFRIKVFKNSPFDKQQINEDLPFNYSFDSENKLILNSPEIGVKISSPVQFQISKSEIIRVTNEIVVQRVNGMCVLNLVSNNKIIHQITLVGHLISEGEKLLFKAENKPDNKKYIAVGVNKGRMNVEAIETNEIAEGAYYAKGKIWGNLNRSPLASEEIK
ncbi:Hypothetical_protein [Hexamita inflata]|uniref:Hypothetical_protein n=1 Tax=Hexamita inflata TaxID=28002 RepID=A0AA86V115_9EUKA|nr:Hypothetical protein HINF_LOCUS64034 [Hexamita inflata]